MRNLQVKQEIHLSIMEKYANLICLSWKKHKFNQKVAKKKKKIAHFTIKLWRGGDVNFIKGSEKTWNFIIGLQKRH